MSLYEINFTESAAEDYQYWSKSNKRILKKINALLDDMCEHPTLGIGKPEQLRYELSGLWSRRIDTEHRIVYRIENNAIFIVSCRFHYK